MAGPLALTFDDGPWPGGTDQILSVLGAHGMRATFFVWGEQAQAHPEIVRAAIGAGHGIQPHCWSHRLSHHEMTPDAIRDDIDRVLSLLRDLGASESRLWRPPWGSWLRGTTDVLAAERGLHLTGWAIDSNDWRGRSAGAMHADIRAALDRVSGRAAQVLLMHDSPREPGQWKRRQDVNQTIELVRLLCADSRLSLGPQVDAVPGGLNPPSRLTLRGQRRRRRNAVAPL